MWGQENDGYMNDSVVNEPSKVTNSVVVGGDDKSRLTLPCSLSQIAKLTRPDEGLIVHGLKVSVVTVVAKIVEVLESTSYKTQYLIDDLTNGGPMEVQYIRSDTGLPNANGDEMSVFDESGMGTDENSTREPKVDDYIRVYGQVKFASDRPQIMAYKVLPVHDPNEITMHILEVIRESMYAMKCKAGDFDKPGTSNAFKSNTNDTRLDLGDAGLSSKLPTIQKHILDVVKRHAEQAAKNNQPCNGISTNDIHAQLKHLSRTDLENALHELNSEGHIWNGQGEDIWCAAD